MRMFLLKQIEQSIQKAVENVSTVFYKPSMYAFVIATLAVVMSPVYAEQQLSDAELDSKFIEVQIRQICTLEKEKSKDDPKKSAYITDEVKSVQYICRTDDLFVKAIKNDGSSEVKQLGTTDKASNSADSVDSSALLAGIFQNIRSLGGGELLGVPVGVSNTGNPIGFGSERYSYKWAGNLGDIFQPFYKGGVIAPYSVYDQSDLGFGFRAEAHFPDQLPQPRIQSFIIGN